MPDILVIPRLTASLPEEAEEMLFAQGLEQEGDEVTVFVVDEGAVGGGLEVASAPQIPTRRARCPLTKPGSSRRPRPWRACGVWVWSVPKTRRHR